MELLDGVNVCGGTINQSLINRSMVGSPHLRAMLEGAQSMEECRGEFTKQFERIIPWMGFIGLSLLGRVCSIRKANNRVKAIPTAL